MPIILDAWTAYRVVHPPLDYNGGMKGPQFATRDLLWCVTLVSVGLACLVLVSSVRIGLTLGLGYAILVRGRTGPREAIWDTWRSRSCLDPSWWSSSTSYRSPPCCAPTAPSTPPGSRRSRRWVSGRPGTEMHQARTPTPTRPSPPPMSGNLPTDTLPTYREHPCNILSLFGPFVPVHRYEPVTDLCPPDFCEQRPAESLPTVVLDAAVVYGHRTLPEDLRDSLPSIDSSWGGFGDELGGPSAATAGGSDTSPDAERPTTQVCSVARTGCSRAEPSRPGGDARRTRTGREWVREPALHPRRAAPPTVGPHPLGD